jgi:hypothetical protein
MNRYFDRTCILLLVIVGVVSGITLPKETYPGDPLAMREETRAWLEGRLDVPAELASQFGDPGQFFVKNVRDGKFYSKYGWMNSLLYAPPMLMEKVVEGSLAPLDSQARTGYLNFWNWLCGLVLAWLLYQVVSLYTSQPKMRIAYVLACFYATFQWNYMRTQSSEIFQLIFFTAWAWLVLRESRKARGGQPRSSWMAACWALILALTGVRIIFALLAPIFGVVCMVLGRERDESWGAAATKSIRWNLIPGIVFLAVVACINFVKFGSPFLTGYHQWRPDIHGFNGDWTESLYGLLFNAQWSLLIHFPLMILALLGWNAFSKKWFFDAALNASVLAVFYMVVGKLPSWRGEACYGPRYFLFLMPVFCVPAITAVESWLAEPKRLASRLGLALAAVVLAYSVFLQEQVNRHTFMAYYQLRDPLAPHMTQLTAWYFDGSHYGRVNWDLSRAQGDMDRFEFWAQLKKIYPPENLEGYRQHVQRVLEKTNYYWF